MAKHFSLDNLEQPKPALTFRLEDHWFPIPEAAQHLRISRAFLYRLIEAGRIKPVKLDKRTFVTGSELRRFMGEAAATAK